MESETPTEQTNTHMKAGHPFWRRLRQRYTVSFVQKTEDILGSLSPFEKVVWWVLVAALVVSTAGILSNVNYATTKEVPARGGSIHEGVIGAPRFINPLLALSNTDRDLSMLIYAGLMRPGPDGNLVPELAERYSVSEDGTEYNFVLRDDARFHDGTPITSDDIVFTIQSAQNSTLKSPRRSDWDGVTVEKVNDREVLFKLGKPYAPFLENATLGILPRHLWVNVPLEEFAFSNLNIRPVGAGPYRINNVVFDRSGVPTYYELRPFRQYTLGRPFIDQILVHFFANVEQQLSNYSSGMVNSISSISSEALTAYKPGQSELLRVSFPRIFAVFFNQNKNHVFTEKAVRRALDTALDKQRIVDEALGGYGTVVDSPIPPGIIAKRGEGAPLNETADTGRMEQVREILEGAGWEFLAEENTWEKDGQVLSFSIATANTPELKSAAQAAVDMWSAVGIPVKINIFETGDLNQNVIRPRAYEALLFGEVVGRSLDLFAFWHSSQKDDPGLNIALYTNATADKLLAEARTISDREERDELYLEFVDEVRDDMPAVFLYSPDFLYIVPKSLKGVQVDLVTTPSERFANVHEWHIYTQRVWYFFD
jgi:peptide/nickel transport system substrate-binding protein